MDATLHALSEILLKAIPTCLLLLVLHFYLKKMFFEPMEETMEKRYQATDGARKLAEESLARAAAKTAEYAATLRAARGQVYQAQEKLHQQLQADQSAQLAQVRQETGATVSAERAQVATEVAAAKTSLARDAEQLAEQIANTVLRSAA